jgi:hypothetical protein
VFLPCSLCSRASRPLPIHCLSFFHDDFFAEVQLGPNELGRGEFGTVFQVDALTPESCECPKCLLKAFYNAPGDRHKLEAAELNVLGKDDDDDGKGSLQGTCTEDSTIKNPQNGALHNKNIPNNDSARNTQQFESTDQLQDGSNLDQITTWTDQVEWGLDKMFGEESHKDEEDDGDDPEGKDDVVSDLSLDADGSRIRAHGKIDDQFNANSVRENFDTYRKCYMQRNCIRQGRPRYAVKRLRGDLQEGETKYNAAIDLAVEAKFLAA